MPLWAARAFSEARVFSRFLGGHTIWLVRRGDAGHSEHHCLHSQTGLPSIVSVGHLWKVGVQSSDGARAEACGIVRTPGMTLILEGLPKHRCGLGLNCTLLSSPQIQPV